MREKAVCTDHIVINSYSGVSGAGKKSDLERKKEIAEYIRLFLRGGFKWKKIMKEKI